MKSNYLKIILLAAVVLLGVLLVRHGVFHRADRGALLRRAAALEEKGRYRQALPILIKLAESEENSPEKNNAVVSLARCYTRLGEWERAESWWEKAADLPSPACRDEALFNRSEIAEKRGRAGAAQGLREEYLRRFPLSARAAAVRLSRARMRKKSGDPAGAREDYLFILENYPRRPEAGPARRELGAINLKLLYSPRRDEYGMEYTVQSGDTLASISAAYQTTPLLLRDINGIKGEIIRVGQKLKVPSGRFRVLVSKSKNTVILYLGDKFFNIYPAGTGRGGCSPVGTFAITTKLIDPPWFHNGEKIAPGDPANILGTRWMGFSDPYADYGIHGTTEPGTIGTQCSAGCVRMRNEDVEELFKLLPRGTMVTIEE